MMTGLVVVVVVVGPGYGLTDTEQLRAGPSTARTPVQSTAQLIGNIDSLMLSLSGLPGLENYRKYFQSFSQIILTRVDQSYVCRDKTPGRKAPA